MPPTVRRPALLAVTLGTAVVTAFATFATAPSAAATAPEQAAERPAERDHARVVGVGGPTTMILRPGCRQTYHAAAVFDAQAGEDYLAVINAEDATGRDIDGDEREGEVTESGRVTVTAPLLLCGSVHDPGIGEIKVGLRVGATDIDLRKPVRIAFADQVSLAKPAKRVRKGKRLRMHGRWSRGTGFAWGLTTYVRKSVKVRIYFKPTGRKWRRVATSRIDSQGRWSKRVEVRKPGKWQARVLRTARLQPARSTAHRVRVKR